MRGLCAAERGLRGPLGGGGADAVPVREAEPRPGLRAGHERDHRPHLSHLRKRRRQQQQTARGGRLLLLLHEPDVRDQGLLHPHPGRDGERHQLRDGQAGRLPAPPRPRRVGAARAAGAQAAVLQLQMVDVAAVARVLAAGRGKNLGFLVRRQQQIQLSHLHLLCHDYAGEREPTQRGLRMQREALTELPAHGRVPDTQQGGGDCQRVTQSVHRLFVQTLYKYYPFFYVYYDVFTGRVR